MAVLVHDPRCPPGSAHAKGYLVKLRVLLLIDDPDLLARVRLALKRVDAFVRTPRAGCVTWGAAEETLADVLIASHGLVPQPPATCLRALAQSLNAPAVIILSASDDAEERAAMRAAGAAAVLLRNVSDKLLGEAIRGIIEERRNLLTKSIAARRATPQAELSDFVSVSPVMQSFLKTVQRIADSDAPLLVTGETGVGKERLARAIHHDCRRADGPFISINCGAIPENLLESQLFGHERGAFTGATRTQRGCFELAHDGTLFLDEISEMPFHLQVKLLHVLQDYEVAPIGSERRIPVNVRVIAATNRDIQEEVSHKRFRKDLYYRLSVVSIDVPPLRERRGDIPTLAASMLEGLATRIGREVNQISPAALDALCNYAWPGNVRELINIIERAVLLCDGNCVTTDDLPPGVAAGATSMLDVPASVAVERIPDPWLAQPLQHVLTGVVARVERAYLKQQLAATGGRVGETAKRAGLEPRSLFNKMKRHGLRKEDFRPPKPGP